MKLCSITNVRVDFYGIFNGGIGRLRSCRLQHLSCLEESSKRIHEWHEMEEIMYKVIMRQSSPEDINIRESFHDNHNNIAYCHEESSQLQWLHFDAILSTGVLYWVLDVMVNQLIKNRWTENWLSIQEKSPLRGNEKVYTSGLMSTHFSGSPALLRKDHSPAMVRSRPLKQVQNLGWRYRKLTLKGNCMQYQQDVTWLWTCQHLASPAHPQLRSQSDQAAAVEE